MTNVTTLRPSRFSQGKGYRDVGVLRPVVKRNLMGVDAQTKQATLPVYAHQATYTVRDDGSPQFLGVVGDGYKVVQTKGLLETVETSLVNTLEPRMLHGAYYLDRASFGGAKVYREYVFPSVQPHNRTMRGDLGFRLVVSNGYDGNTSVGLLWGFVDFMCTNGMVVGTDMDTYSRKHTSGFTLDRVSNAVERGLDAVAHKFRLMDVYADTKVDDEKVRQFFEKVASERRADRLFEQYQEEVDVRGRNAWSVVSAMTYYASHNSDRFGVRGSAQNDNEAATLLARQMEVNGWMNSGAWQQLVAA